MRFVGEPIAAVFAPTVAEAEDMADRVEIEIAESPAVVNASDAMSPDAPCVHDIGNVVVDGAKRRCVLSARTRRDICRCALAKPASKSAVLISHGGIAQGIGNALLEEVIYDTLGNIQTATLADYCLRRHGKSRRSNCTTSKHRRHRP